MENTISEMKTTLEGIKKQARWSRGSNQQVGRQGRKKYPVSEIKQNKKRFKKKKDSLRELWDGMKCNNIHIIGIPDREKLSQG